MVNSSFYQIYEFSQYDENDGSRPYGTRLSGGMTWEDVPQVLKEAKQSLEDQLLHREVRLDPCVFGQLLPHTQNPKVWYALVAVAHLNLDRFGRPITMLRYFWCECEPEDWHSLQAILKWFERLQKIPLWSREDKLHQNPLEFYQVEKSSINPPRPQTLQDYLLPPNYEQGSDPWKALRQLHSDVLGTVWALKKQNPAGNYPVAWAWNVSDLNNLNGCFIKPVDEVAYNRLKPRIPMIVSNAALPSTSSHQEKLLPSASGHSSPLVGSSVTMSLQQALKTIVENFTIDFEHSPNQKRFRQALQILNQGLLNCEPGQLPQDFKALGCDLRLWETTKVHPYRLVLLFLWTLLLPEENINSLLVLLTTSHLYKPKQSFFKKFLRAIHKTFEVLDDKKLHESFFAIYLSLLDLTCYFLGALFVAYRQNPNSRETQQLQALFKNLLQEPSWSYYLNTVLIKCLDLPSPDAFSSSSPKWKEFEQTLRGDLRKYLNVWKIHYNYYHQLGEQFPIEKQEYENKCYRVWPKQFREIKPRWQWKPFLQKSGILDAFSNQKALAWQALFDHLDQGYSTVTGWPNDRLLPGGLTFVPQTYAPHLRSRARNQSLSTKKIPPSTRWKFLQLITEQRSVIAGSMIFVAVLKIVLTIALSPKQSDSAFPEPVIRRISKLAGFGQNIFSIIGLNDNFSGSPGFTWISKTNEKDRLII